MSTIILLFLLLLICGLTPFYGADSRRHTDWTGGLLPGPADLTKPAHESGIER